MARKPKGLFDLPVEFPCRHCGNSVKVELRRFQASGFEYICRSCPGQFQLGAEEASRILGEHGKKLDALSRTFGGG